MRTTTRRMLGAAAAAAFLVTSAGTASAHHCYKEQWNAAAYENHLRGNTAWMPLSDMTVMFMASPEEPWCAGVVDAAVHSWVHEAGFEQEPLIHSRATIGGGAFYKKGKMPPPIDYLTDDQFGMRIGGHVLPAMMAAGCTPPPEE